jgi:uncharacterized membrane protein
MAARVGGAVAGDVSHRLVEWTHAGVIDEQTAERIRIYERNRSGSTRMRWPVLVALAFGSLTVAAGVLLFVSAHWDALSPPARFALVILLVSIFHVAGAFVADRFPAMASALHAAGTAALGAGIYLAGQIFNLDEHWPGGLLLWAAGAALAAAILKDAAQVALVAMLTPAWLAGEWEVASERLHVNSGPVAASGLFLLALTYFTSSGHERLDPRRRVLVWIGGIALLPMALYLAVVADESSWRSEGFSSRPAILLGWTLAIGLSLAVAFVFRRKDAWPAIVAAVWVLVLVGILGPLSADAAMYAWWALGAVGLVAWGVHDSRPERINLGAAMFAATVLAFYFSQVMDKLGRSLSLIGLGVIFLMGGWALERVRRRLVQQARGEG